MRGWIFASLQLNIIIASFPIAAEFVIAFMGDFFYLFFQRGQIALILVLFWRLFRRLFRRGRRLPSAAAETKKDKSGG